jgi:hypothetical protein
VRGRGTDYKKINRIPPLKLISVERILPKSHRQRQALGGSRRESGLVTMTRFPVNSFDQHEKAKTSICRSCLLRRHVVEIAAANLT